MSDKPRLFIGSSTKGADVARALADGLGDVAAVELWWERGFELTRANVESLERVAEEVEFAVLVLTADDARDRGGGKALVPRDNVVFELGLFMGKLGRRRTFAIRPRYPLVELPTDLGGVNIPTFGSLGTTSDPLERDRSHREAVSGAVQAIRAAVASAAALSVQSPSSEIVRVYPQRAFVTRREWRDFIKNAQSDLWLYGMVEGGYARDKDTAETFSLVPPSCDIRVLLLDPECPQTAEIDEDEGAVPGTLKLNIGTALNKFAAMRASRPNQIKIRVYDSFPQVSIVRADDRALVTTYIRPLAGDDCPTLEVRGHGDESEGLFERYRRNFHKVWNSGKDWP